MERIKFICVFLTIFFLCSCTNNKKDNGNLSANIDNAGTRDSYPFEFYNGTYSYYDLNDLYFLADTSLKSLKLSRGTFSDLSSLSALQNLEVLSIRSNDNITDITPLGSLTNLRELELALLDNLTDISSVGLLTNLEKLEIRSCDKIKSIEPLSSLVNLKYLLLYNEIKLFKKIVSLQQLEVLELSYHNQTTETDVSYIAQLHNLKELRLSLYPLEGCVINIDQLKNLVNLEKLWIRYLEKVDLSWIPSLKNLKELSLTYCTVDDVSPLLELPNLTRIDFNHTKVKDIAPLAESKSLKIIVSPILENWSPDLRARLRENGIEYIPYTNDR